MIITRHSILLCLLFAESLSAKTLVVGEAIRFEDKYNTTINHFSKGFETAKGLFEREHPGVKIEFKKFPHELPLETVAEAANRIIKEKVPAVIGGELSAEAKVLSDLLDPQKIVFISHSASSPIVTEGKPFTFRTGFADEQLARALAQFVIETLKPKKIGIFANLSNPYSAYLSSQFEKELLAETKNIPVVWQKVISGVDDYSKNVEFFKNEGATHVLSCVNDGDFTNLVVQSARKEFFPTFIGSDSWGSNGYVFSRFVENGSHSDKFVAFRTYYWKEGSRGGLVDKFREQFKKKFHEEPNAWNAVAFDAAWVLFTAMNRAKNPSSSDEIRRELLKIKDLQLVTTSHFTFGPNNAAVKDIPIYKLSRSGIEFQREIR